MTPTERRAATAALAAIPDVEPRLIIATGRYIGEGFDDARLDTLFLTMPVSFDLPLPSPRPAGTEWIDAYRHWVGGG